jgi:hypothetical protein
LVEPESDEGAEGLTLGLVVGQRVGGGLKTVGGLEELGPGGVAGRGAGAKVRQERA